jgi:hypothetical protein
MRPASGIDRSASWCRLPSGGAPSARSIPTGEALTSRRLPERPRGRATWSLPSGVIKELAVPLRAPGRPTDYVFCARPAGRCGSTGSASRVAACELGAGLPGLRIHDLRHTAVALWIAEGASPKRSPPAPATPRSASCSTATATCSPSRMRRCVTVWTCVRWRDGTATEHGRLRREQDTLSLPRLGALSWGFPLMGVTGFEPVASAV